MCKCCGGYKSFIVVYYLVSEIGLEGGLVCPEINKDVLDMCNLGTAHPNKDVHVYFEHVADAMLKIVSDDEPINVVIEQVSKEVEE